MKFTFGPIEILPDCQYVVDGMNDKRYVYPGASSNSDLWALVGTYAMGRCISVYKVKAHYTPDEFIEREAWD